MQKQEIGILLGALLLSFLLIDWIVMGGAGIAVCLFVIVYYAIAIIYAKKIGIQLSRSKMLLLIPIGLVALCFGLYNNGLLKFFNILLLYGLVMLQTSYMYEAEVYERFSKLFLLDIFHTGVVLPFANMTSIAESTKKYLSGETKSKAKIGLKVVIGCVVSFPLIMIIVQLLISSDMAFAGFMNMTINNMFENLGETTAKLILTVILFFPMYGFFYGLQTKKKYFENAGEARSIQWIDCIIAFTFMTLLCLVYGTYCFSQLAYFTSAFKMFLPESFTFAEYARRGFFEITALSLINLGIMTAFGCWTKNITTAAKEKWQKGYMLFISVFTLFLILSALFKLFMYIDVYGLTPLRVYTSWFLMLVFAVYIIIILRLFIKRINLVKAIFISFIVMYLGLNFANVDKWIAYHNVKLYMMEKEKGIDINGFYRLSSSAASEVVKLINEEDKEMSSQAKDLLNHYYDKSNVWQNLNLESYKANQIIKEYQ